MLPPRLPPCKLHPSVGHDEHDGDDDDDDDDDDGGLYDGQVNGDGGDDDGDDDHDVEAMSIREVGKKSKWKFKMAFAIRGPTPPPL